jgi:protein-S-isoprenylcysteine O-methyltransferase Ste14
MSDLLDALEIGGRVVRLIVGSAIWLSFGSVMVAIAAGQAVLEAELRLPPLAIVSVVALVWAMWTWWHSSLFARHRTKYLIRVRRPYRRAFLTDIFPGISIGFSQMLRPAWNGSNLSMDAVWPHIPPTTADGLDVLIGWGLGLSSLVLFATAWRTLGAARVGFVPEFMRPDAFVPSRQGPYGHVRHPLFWSGIGISWALALVSGTAVGYATASLNMAYGLAYNELEDRRLIAVFGFRYGDYAKELPHIVPWHLTGRWLRRRSRQRDPSGDLAPASNRHGSLGSVRRGPSR